MAGFSFLVLKVLNFMEHGAGAEKTSPTHGVLRYWSYSNPSLFLDFGSPKENWEVNVSIELHRIPYSGAPQNVFRKKNGRSILS